VPALNGSAGSPLTSAFAEADDWWREGANGAKPSDYSAGYSSDELVLRADVPLVVLRQLCDLDCAGGAAIDVVRLAVVSRLLRSGVPVARAAALVQAAEHWTHNRT
jgi:hypothetical protein